jgi:hypothetical protein
MYLNYYYQNVLFLPLSDEADTGSGGDQPARNSLKGRNGKWGRNIPHNFLFFHSSHLCLKKRIASLEAKKQTKDATNKTNKKPIINPKKGQRISGQDKYTH